MHTSLDPPRRNAKGEPWQCVGRRNESAGNGLGNGRVPPPTFTPRWKVVDARPQRPRYFTDSHAALLRGLLGKGLLSPNAHALASVLHDMSASERGSQNHSRGTVVKSIRQLAETLGWGTTRVKLARRELRQLGLIEWHNRCRTDLGVVANRYSFAWNLDLTRALRWRDETAIAKLGSPYAHLHQAERQRLEREYARNVMAREHRAALVQWIADSAVDHTEWATFKAAIEQRCTDRTIRNFALSEGQRCWWHAQACRFAQQLDELDLPLQAKLERINQHFHGRPELADTARRLLRHLHKP